MLLTVPPPPANIYTEAVLGRGKEEEKFTTKSVHHLVNCFILFYNTLYLITVHHIPLYILIIGWILHVIQYIYTRYEILFVVHSTFVTFVYTHTSSVSTFEVHHCTPYIFRHYCIALPYNSIHSWGTVLT